MGLDVFISHSSADAATANAVVHVLESNGVRCWIAPRDIQPGANYMQSLTAAIRGAKIVVLIFSTKANESAHVNREIQQAAELNIPILPLRIEKAEPSDSLAYALVGQHWLDAISPPMEDSLRQLAQAVLRLLGEGPTRPEEASVPSTWARIAALSSGRRGAGPEVDEYGLPVRREKVTRPPQIWLWILPTLFAGFLTPLPYIIAAVKRPRPFWIAAASLSTMINYALIGLIFSGALIADTGFFFPLVMLYVLGGPVVTWLAALKYRDEWWQDVEAQRSELMQASRETEQTPASGPASAGTLTLQRVARRDSAASPGVTVEAGQNLPVHGTPHPSGSPFRAWDPQANTNGGWSGDKWDRQAAYSTASAR